MKPQVSSRRTGQNHSGAYNLSKQDLCSQSNYPLRKISRYSASSRHRPSKHSRSPIRNIESERHLQRDSQLKNSRYSANKESNRYSKQQNTQREYTDSNMGGNQRRFQNQVSERRHSGAYDNSQRSGGGFKGTQRARQVESSYQNNESRRGGQNASSRRSEIVESKLENKRRFDHERDSQNNSQKWKNSKVASGRNRKEKKDVDYEEYLRNRYPDMPSVNRQRSKSPNDSRVSRHSRPVVNF